MNDNNDDNNNTNNTGMIPLLHLVVLVVSCFWFRFNSNLIQKFPRKSVVSEANKQASELVGWLVGWFASNRVK